MTDEQFDQFWAQYPRKDAKIAARKAFDKALKIVGFDDLMAGLERYCEQIERTGKDRQFIKQPATWLNQGCWDDEHLPAPSLAKQLSAIDAGPKPNIRSVEIINDVLWPRIAAAMKTTQPDGSLGIRPIDTLALQRLNKYVPTYAQALVAAETGTIEPAHKASYDAKFEKMLNGVVNAH